MCAHGRRQLPAFDFLLHLLFGLDNQRTRKKAVIEPKSSELSADITNVHLVTRHFAPFSSFALKFCPLYLKCRYLY